MKTRAADAIFEFTCESMSPAIMLKLTQTVGAAPISVGFTSSDKTIPFGGLNYQPEQSLTGTAFQQKVGFSTDNIDFEMLTSDLITVDDLRAGLWNDCIVEFFIVPKRSDTTISTVPLGTYLGTPSRIDDEHAWTLDLRGYGERLSQPVIKVVSIMCRHRLGDDVCRVNLKPAVWLATTAYTLTQAGDASVGSRVRPTTYNGLHAKCTVAGTSAGTEPIWPANPGQTIVDGTVTWTTYDAFTKEGIVSQVYDLIRFEAALMTDLNDRFKYGKLTWLTGANAQLVEDIRHHATGGAFTLVDEMAFPVVVGDTFEAQVGCHLRITEDCIGSGTTEFDNVDNFGGFNFLPGGDAASELPPS